VHRFRRNPYQLRRNLGGKEFRVDMVGYPYDALGYRVYNHVTRCITTYVHVMFHEDVPGFASSPNIDSHIIDALDADDDLGQLLQSHALALNEPDADDAPRVLDAPRPQ
jgi:hypothetical protein